MPVGRDLPDIKTAVVDADGLAPVDLVGGQVFRLQIATRRLDESGNLFGQRATVKTVGVALGD